MGRGPWAVDRPWGPRERAGGLRLGRAGNWQAVEGSAGAADDLLYSVTCCSGMCVCVCVQCVQVGAVQVQVHFGLQVAGKSRKEEEDTGQVGR